MFGNLGQLAGLLRNAGQIQENMKQMQGRLAAARHTAEAGAGQVSATVDGRGELLSLRIDPGLVAGGDTELIEELTVSAVREAVGRSREAIKQEMEEVTGGMNLEGMMDMLGGPGKP